MTTTFLHTKLFPSPTLRRWLLILLVAVTPSLVSYLLITVQGYHIDDFMPNWGDEVGYWNQINTFHEVGLRGGYFTINELAPKAEFTHFYTYGPWYPAVYGSFAHIIGWNVTTTLAINSLLVGLALVIFCRIARLGERQLWLMVLTLATMWSLLLYLFTAMQEGYQQAIGILLAGVFVAALRQTETVSIRFRLTGLALITFAAVMRLSWAIFYIPFWALTGKNTLRYWIIGIVGTLILTVGVMVVANYTGAPGNNAIFDMLSAFGISLGAGFDHLARYLIRNLGRFFFLPKPGTDVLQTYQVVGLIIGLSAFLIQPSVRQRRSAVGTDAALLTEAVFHLYNLGVTVLAACALYIIGTGGDYRLLACHLLLSLLLLIAFKRYRPVLLIVALNVLFIPVFLQDFRGIVLPKYEPDHTAYAAFKQVADTYIHYQPDAQNAWCNTLLFAVQHFDGTALDATPAGIGLSFFKDPAEPLLTFKSRYLLLDDPDYGVIRQRPDAPQLTYLAESPIGKLYLNQGTACP